MEAIENDSVYQRGKSNISSKSLETTIVGAYIKIENQIASLKTQIKNDNIKLETLTSKMHQLQQQIEIYTHECQVVNEKIKDSNWAFTKEVALSLQKIKKPVPEVQELSEKFMILLEQKETSWKMFQASVKNHDSLKALMDKFNPEMIREENVDMILGLWKNYNQIQPKVAKVARGFSILLDWVTSCMEYKLKKATLENVKRSLVEVQTKMRGYSNNVAEKESLVVTLEEKLTELKQNPKNDNFQKKGSLPSSTTKSSHFSRNQENIGATHHQKSFGKLFKTLSPNTIDIQTGTTGKKSAGQSEDNDQSMGQNASCEVKLEPAQVNAIFSSTYRFPSHFTRDHSIRNDDFLSSSRKNSGIDKIYKIISNHDDRNRENAVLSDSKIFFVKERTGNNTPNSKAGDALYRDTHLTGLRQPLFEEDKTNATCLNSVRNPLLDDSGSKKKQFATIGTKSAASIGMSTYRQQDELTQRSHAGRVVFTPRLGPDAGSENNFNLPTARESRIQREIEKREEDEGMNDQSFAACCKKGINKLFCS